MDNGADAPVFRPIKGDDIIVTARPVVATTARSEGAHHPNE
jgi:hypothetical protein